MKATTRVTFFFLFCCVVIFFASHSPQFIQLRPQSYHAWRQADCVSYTLNYYQNNQPLLEPQTHTLTGKDGHAASEFPIIYYITAQLYKLFGPNEWFLRAINFALFFSGCLALLFLGYALFETKWLALLPALFTFTSPYLYYYALNFLPDVPALSLALVGCLLAFRFIKSGRAVDWYIACLFFCLAALIKISAGIPFLAFAASFLLLPLITKNTERPRGSALHVLTGSFFVIALNMAWIIYVVHYNTQSGSQQNLTGIYPIWDETFHTILYIGKRTLLEWSLAVTNPLNWLLLVAGIYLLYRRKQQMNFMLLFTLFNIMGALLYSLLWYRAFRDHDYYLINPFIALVWVLIAIVTVIDKNPGIGSLKAVGAFVVILAIMIVYNSTFQLKRYHHFFDKDALSSDYYTVEPYLRSIGIDRHDKVVSVPDKTPNLSLYFLNQPGWTEAFNWEGYNVDLFAKEGAKYLVLGDSAYLQNPLYARHAGKLMGRYKGIYIYEIKN